ncbi:MAG: SbcC/MukB-like Walker B domain-containing protein [Planctomycetota bacterium]|nr:SbcC/MukB-like Walker B domain-containing protein [Planctomycetota bacterium]
MRLRFRWHPISDSSEELTVACKALLRKPSAMSDEDRAALGQFLQQRIAEARSRDDVGTWQQHLADALDYRSWFTFDIERETDGRWQRLTRRTHGTGSGGERAVALIIPMLAALAAYYQSADRDAPRIILMDEAFVGIDNEMRAKFMDLMVQFDLDFMMTSEREWGCYPTMPALAIYHLSTRRGVDAILATRWVWNGNGRTQSDVHDRPRQLEMFTAES